MSIPVLLDCDLAMGAIGSDVDDGFALALALAEPEIDLKAVTTVNGNTDVNTATRLTRELLERLGRNDVPVYRGADRPLLRPLAEQSLRHGFDPTKSSIEDQDECAASAIIRMVREYPHQLTLVAIGPLTNVALALRLDPGIAELIDRLVIMGGTFMRGTGHHAMPGEFNIWVDPEAANIVLSAGIPTEFVGLDVTLQVRLTRADADVLAQVDTEFSRYAAECAHGWISYIAKKYPGNAADQDSCAMHDPLAVAAVTRPELLAWRDVSLKFSCGGEETRGMAIVDFLESADAPQANARIALGVDSQAFTSYFLTSISSL